MTSPRKDADRAARLEQAIRAKKAAARAGRLEIPLRPADEAAVISEAQRGIWLAHQVDPHSPAYNLASAFRVHGPLDVAALQRAFDEVAGRHRILRSTFRAEGDVVMQVVHDGASLPLATVEAGHGEALRSAVREASEPFDLERGPLVRLRLIDDRSAGDRLLLIALHHILADERSLEIMWREVADVYEGRRAPVPRVQYDDYVRWLRHVDGRSDEVEYWRRHLDPLPGDLRLPFEQPVGTGAADGRLVTRTFPASVQEGVRRLAAAVGATPFMVCAFAFRLLVQRYTSRERVAFATPVSARSHPATADMIGYFLNPLVISVDIDEQTPVEAAVGGFCAVLKNLLAHATVPFDTLAARLSPPRERGRHPIFQAMFVYQEARPTPMLGEARLEPVTLDLGASKFDLTLFVTEGTGSLETAVEYRTDRYADEWMSGLLDHYATLLERLPTTLATPVAAVSMLGFAEEDKIRVHERGPALARDDVPLLPAQIWTQARRQPLAPAVVCDGGRHSYGDLERVARTISGRLAATGVRPGDRVGVFLERSVAMVAGIVGIQWAGAAYVPLDPAYPEARTREVLADADVAAVLTTSAVRGRLPAGPWPIVQVDALEDTGRDLPPLVDVSPDSTAYILYTSGSTGRPKGVVVSHDNLRASTAARLQAYDRQPLRFLLVPSVSFDSSVAGLFWTLAVGGTLVVPTDDEARDPSRLSRLIADERVTALLCVPSLYRQLLQFGRSDLHGLDTAIVAGERCSPQLVEEHFRLLTQARLFNEYGPTEATVWASVHEATPADAEGPVAIGRPIPGVRVEVLDALGRRVPAGIPGHAWIVGPTVAQGYWRRHELTDERFFEERTESGTTERRYRSGDWMSWTPDGRLLFHGRDDEQIKLRGYRIEPGEVEAILLDHAAIEEAAVVARALDHRAAASSPTDLVAFVVSRTSGGVGDWRQWLTDRLPDFMVPTHLVEVRRLPRLPNGKVDRRQLRVQPLGSEVRPGQTPSILDTREQALVSLWEGLLGRFGIDVTDNFFERGGHSLLVMEMVASIRRDFGVTLSAADVFEHPTVRELARRMDARGGSQVRPFRHLYPIQPGGSKAPVIVAIPHFFTEMLATRFRGERPVYGLRGVGLRAEGNRGRWPTMTALAEEAVEEIRRRFPEGPYVLAGYSFGASMAIEAARVMESRGIPVRRLYVIAPMPLHFYDLGPIRVQLDGLRKPLSELSRREAVRLWVHANHPLTRRPYARAKRRLVVQPFRRLVCLVGRVRQWRGLPLTPRILHAEIRVERFRLHGHYRPEPLSTPAVFFNATGTDTDAAATWRPYFRGPFIVHQTPDPHDEASVEAARQVILRHLDDMGDE